MKINLKPSVVKIYISYKSEISFHLAQTIYRMLNGDYKVFIDRKGILSFDEWEDTMNEELKKCDIMLVVGEHGAFKSLKEKAWRHCIKHYVFLHELQTAYINNRTVYYIPIERYRFWEDLELKKDGLKPISDMLKKQNMSPLYFKDMRQKIIDVEWECFKDDLNNYVTKHFYESPPEGVYFNPKDANVIKDNNSNDKRDIISTSERQMQIVQQANEFLQKRK